MRLPNLRYTYSSFPLPHSLNNTPTKPNRLYKILNMTPTSVREKSSFQESIRCRLRLSRGRKFSLCIITSAVPSQLYIHITTFVIFSFQDKKYTSPFRYSTHPPPAACSLTCNILRHQSYQCETAVPMLPGAQHLARFL